MSNGQNFNILNINSNQDLNIPKEESTMSSITTKQEPETFVLDARFSNQVIRWCLELTSSSPDDANWVSEMCIEFKCFQVLV